MIQFEIKALYFLISKSNCSLLVCRKAIDFCILSLCLTTLLQSLINSRSSLWDFYIEQPHHLQIKTVQCLPCMCTFHSLFFSYCFTQDLQNILKSSDERKHLYLVSDLIEKDSRLFPLSMILGVVFLDVLNQVE